MGTGTYLKYVRYLDKKQGLEGDFGKTFSMNQWGYQNNFFDNYINFC